MKLENNVRSGATIDVAGADEEYGSLRVGHDFRKLKFRREGFLVWWATCTAAGDVDPALWMMRYLNERYEYNREEKLWFAWLYHTYNLPTAFVYKNEFPDEELASVDRFTHWNNENYPRLRYQNDTKWSKGHLPVMYQSYTDWIGASSQEVRFEGVCSGSPEENFEALWDIVKGSWYKFGRYTAFFYLQTLKHTCGINLDCPTLLLNDYSGSKSHRNGLCLALGKDEWVNVKLLPSQYQWLEDAGADILKEAKSRWPSLAQDFDNFSLETALCSYKKLHRTSRGRYVGYYLDRQSEEIVKAESDNWKGIEWDVLWQGRHEVLGSDLVPDRVEVSKEKMKYFVETGGFHYGVR